jgi:HD-GYP domain-containing protein (c-di-GMP phosphodiesterase class II)
LIAWGQVPAFFLKFSRQPLPVTRIKTAPNHRLSGDELGLDARMGAVCDVCGAITSNHPYKAGWYPVDSLRRMAEWARAGQFDEAVFTPFVQCLGIYPVGMLVRLQSGRLGVVAQQPCSKSLLLPKIKGFSPPRARA